MSKRRNAARVSFNGRSWYEMPHAKMSSSVRYDGKWGISGSAPSATADTDFDSAPDSDFDSAPAFDSDSANTAPDTANADPDVKGANADAAAPNPDTADASPNAVGNAVVSGPGSFSKKTNLSADSSGQGSVTNVGFTIGSVVIGWLRPLSTYRNVPSTADAEHVNPKRTPASNTVKVRIPKSKQPNPFEPDCNLRVFYQLFQKKSSTGRLEKRLLKRKKTGANETSPPIDKNCRGWRRFICVCPVKGPSFLPHGMKPFREKSPPLP